MATAVAGLLNEGTISGQPLAGIRVSPMASSNTAANSTEGTKGSAAGITANDFLTLLVTEMKNQDPTANTDPNEYINQLVNVNSLQQLISINETLTAAFGVSNSNAYAQASAPTGSVNTLESSTKSVPEAEAKQAVTAEGNSAFTRDSAIRNILGLANGNLSIPEVHPAADRLAHALDGRFSVLPTK